LGLPFVDDMLDPYAPGRMTEGLGGEGSQVGDPNFFRHSGVDPSLADAWREVERALQPETVVLAQELSYELPAPVDLATHREVERPLAQGPLAAVAWGEAPNVLCLHGHREQGLVWSPVGERLALEGLGVLAPDLRGCGRSAHLLGAGGYPVSALLRDVVGLV